MQPLVAGRIMPGVVYGNSFIKVIPKERTGSFRRALSAPAQVFQEEPWSDVETFWDFQIYGHYGLTQDALNYEAASSRFSESGESEELEVEVVILRPPP